MATLLKFEPFSNVQNLPRKPPDREEPNGSSSNSCNSQFKFTELWNGIIRHLQEHVELKRRKHKMRSYDNCFTGNDAVDVVFHYLQQHGGLEQNVELENVVKLCQLLMESNVFEAVSCSSHSTKKTQFEDTANVYYSFLGEIPDRTSSTTTPCWCEDQRHKEKHDRIHCSRTPGRSVNTPSRKRKRGTSFNLGKQKPDTTRNEYHSAFTPMERNSKRRNSFGVGKFKAPTIDTRESTNMPFERGKKTRNTFAVGRFKTDLRFGDNTSPENVFERKSLRRSSFGFGKRKQALRKTDAGRVIENPCTMPKADILQNILGQPKGMNNDRSKRRKLDQEEINTIWKEATLQRLLHLVDLPHLDDILECSEDFEHDQTPGSCRSSLYMSSLRRSPRLAKPESDHWLAAAHDCLEAHPEGQIIIGNYHGNTPASLVLKQARKQLLFQTISKLFTDRENPLISDHLTRIMTMIIALLARGKTMRAIELTQISMMLLPADSRGQLKGLLSFMSEASKEDNVKLSFEAFNRMTVIHTFTAAIITCPTLSEIQAKNIVAFIMDCQHKVFKVPEGVKVASLARIHRIEHWQTDLCKVYCKRITSREFDRQKGEGTRHALRDMTNSIVDDITISLKEKKQFLQRFHKHHSDLYQKYFSDLM